MMENDLDQIQRSEQRMAEIASLMSLFSTKVSEQEEQIQSIHDNAVRSVAHVQSGNQELRHATERRVTFRIVVLFVLATLSFSLVFLDWMYE